jgi:hypothetical protein
MRRWTVVFALVSVAAIALSYLVVWASNGFTDIGLDLQGNIAMVLGAILLSALSVGLMALMFYSDRSGRDDEVGGVRRDRGD